MGSSLIPLMLTLPLVGAVVALLVSRWQRLAAVVGVVAAALVGLVLLLANPDEAPIVYDVVGRALMFDSYARSILLLLAAGLVLLGLTALLRPPSGAAVAAGLVAFVPLAAAFMLDSISLGSVLVLVALALPIPALVAGRYGSAAAVWRVFLMSVFAIVLFLLADWLLVTGQGGSSTARLSLLGGALLLLGGLPFHIWVSGLARETRPLALALGLGLVYGAVSLFVLGVLEVFPLVRTSAEFQTAVRWSAALTALVAGLLAVRARSWGEVVSRGLLLEMGFLLLTLVMPVEIARQTAMLAWVGRVLALLLVAAALGLPAGHAYRSPLLLYAGLSLLGLPLTPAFSARWTEMLYALAGGASGVPWVALLLAAAVALAVLGLARVARQPAVIVDPAPAQRIQGIIVTILALTSLLVSILPQTVLNSF